MIEVAITKPYRFSPPVHNAFWLRLAGLYLPHYLRRSWGVEPPQVFGLERLKASLDAGHGVALAANHIRPCDPFLIATTHRQLGRSFNVMASWHLFAHSRFQGWVLRRLGVFSLFREGLDRRALHAAIDGLAAARRPLIVFPEGRISRSNDCLGELMDGVAFLARAAARSRARTDSGQVVVHPVAMRYTFPGDLRKAVDPVLGGIEERLGWFPRAKSSLVDRVRRLGEGLLSIKEVEYFGSAQTGPCADRVRQLLARVLEPLEARYVGGERDSSVAVRVKKVRCALLPALSRNEGSEQELAEKRLHLSECSLAQLLDLYPPGYLDGQPTVERLLETVERYEEDVTGHCRIHRPMHCRIDIDEAIPASPERPRVRPDPITKQLDERLRAMLASTASLCHAWKE